MSEDLIPIPPTRATGMAMLARDQIRLWEVLPNGHIRQLRQVPKEGRLVRNTRTPRRDALGRMFFVCDYIYVLPTPPPATSTPPRSPTHRKKRGSLKINLTSFVVGLVFILIFKDSIIGALWGPLKLLRDVALAVWHLLF